jgi:hypothetical protein
VHEHGDNAPQSSKHLKARMHAATVHVPDLPFACRPDGEQESTQYILNLLQLMEENSVAKTFETFALLLEHWSRRRVYGAMLATVEDMRAAGIRPPHMLLQSAAQKASAVRTGSSIMRLLHDRSCRQEVLRPVSHGCSAQVGMHQEAQAIFDVLSELGVHTSNNHRRPQRSNSERGRVFNG